jgi:hypothetical protein
VRRLLFLFLPFIQVVEDTEVFFLPGPAYPKGEGSKIGAATGGHHGA